MSELNIGYIGIVRYLEIQWSLLIYLDLSWAFNHDFFFPTRHAEPRNLFKAKRSIYNLYPINVGGIHPSFFIGPFGDRVSRPGPFIWPCCQGLTPEPYKHRNGCFRLLCLASPSFLRVGGRPLISGRNFSRTCRVRCTREVTVYCLF